MNRSTALAQSRSIKTLAAFALLLAALLLTIAPISAAPKDGGNGKGNDRLHTPVSSDGSAVPDSIGNGKQPAESLPTEGTGELVNSGQDQVNEAEVAPVAAPGQEAGIESVIGADGRYQITGTTTYPYRAITHITSSIGGCTGWLIGSNTVVTAGHCVYGSSGWATNVRVYPGRNGSSTPYGSCTARTLYSVTGWTSSRDRNYDYGAIKLNCTVGNSTGYFGYRWTSSSLTGQAAYTAGYPGDKAYATMWRSNDSVRITQTYRLYYANDTYGGQSGSPVWNGYVSTCNPCGIAIHAYGVDGTGYNGGTRITQAVFNNLTNWKNAP